MAFHIFLFLTIAWFVFMTWLSHQDGEHTGETSWKLAETISHMSVLPFLDDFNVDVLNGHLRKMAHVIVFLVFTMLLGLTLLSGEWPLWYLGFSVFWAWADEATKPMIAGRHFSWYDVWLNLIGMLIGLGILSVVLL